MANKSDNAVTICPPKRENFCCQNNKFYFVEKPKNINYLKCVLFGLVLLSPLPIQAQSAAHLVLARQANRLYTYIYRNERTQFPKGLIVGHNVQNNNIQMYKQWWLQPSARGARWSSQGSPWLAKALSYLALHTLLRVKMFRPQFRGFNKKNVA